VTLAMHFADDDTKEEEIAYDIDENGQRFVKTDVVAPTSEEALGEDNMAASHDEISVVKGKLRDIQVSVKQL